MDEKDLNKKIDKSIALLPGSRNSEITQIGNLMVKAARELKEENPDYTFFMPLASRHHLALLEEGTDDIINISYGDSQEVLKKLTLLLKKNGTLIVGTPNINCIAFKLFKKNFRLLGPGHLCLFNEKSLRSIIESCGFKVFKKEFPFFKTKYFNLKNLFQLSQIHKISPPFYGSIMTIYAQKK